MKISTAAKEYLIEIEVRKFTPKTIRSYRNNLNLFLRFCEEEAGIAEIEIDKETCELKLIDYVAVVDCGTVINPNLARIQTEGGLAQGIGMALFEDVTYSPKGVLAENSFMQYKIPSRMDVGTIRVEFESSYEPTGPFGAKSIGEIVINTPSPAIANAVANATGVRIRELPITSEKIFKALHS